MTYQPIIGLEVHVELATKSKMFCGCPAKHFAVEPNTHTCPVCLGLPGALPVPNRKAVEWTILLGLALNCRINTDSKFDRKNYFYPDLPKGYQITQYDEPLCVNGTLQLQETSPLKAKTVRVRRVHLEEDTGKLQHTTLNGGKVALVDFNRSGVPLVEIVTEPDFSSIEEVDVFLKKLQRIIRYLGISNADMEKGSMRLEPSISINSISNPNIQFPISNDQLPKYRVELKNINSFKFARKALEYEIQRQTELLQSGETPTQQTRGWSEEKNATVPQREKEEAHDYCYFPEPDIPPIHVDAQWLAEIKNGLPELPDAKIARFIKAYNVSDYTANLLCGDKATADFFEQAVKDGASSVTPQDIANWMVNKKDELPDVPAELVTQIANSQKTVAISAEDLDQTIIKALSKFPQAVVDYKSGKIGAIGPIIGAILKDTNLDKQQVIAAIKKHLEA